MTKNLTAIKADLKQKMAKLAAISPEDAHDLIGGAISLFHYGEYWDIQDLREGTVKFPLTPPIDQIGLTCAVSGKVFDQQAVNYCLAGLMSAYMTPADAVEFKALALGYTAVQGVISSETSQLAAEKRAWFAAGAAGDPSLPAEPAAYEDFAWPGNKPYQGKLNWHIGGMSGQD